MATGEGRRRVVIEGIEPEIDGGRYPIKRTVGEKVTVEVDAFTDGHDSIAGVLLYRREDDPAWTEVPLEPLVNDRWQAEFLAASIGRYVYTVEAWVDHFLTWQRDFKKRVDAGQDVSVDLLIGAEHLAEAATRAEGDDRRQMDEWVAILRKGTDREEQIRIGLSPGMSQFIARYPNREMATRYPCEFAVVVDRERARYSAWYEFFPRSASSTPGVHGTFRDCEARLPYVAAMGFDVVYLPPIHPIGRKFRKGRNNSVTAEPGDVGSPWAIGSEEGGHKAIHPDLGTLDDFRSLVVRARELGIDIALDIAFQCSPDHPYVREHPEWFRHRPDGTIQYAENPPKKYQDIYPFNFETEHWRALWAELKSIFDHWIAQGVRIFRVDNPHTKPFPFWEWCITEIKREHPDVIFLAEAFTRPKIMYRLAKLGYSQSYTYFAWRNTKRDLTEYFTELTKTKVAEFFRPNVWPNTPDILTEALQMGGRSIFMQRFVLAATLGATYGIYGPAFELQEHRPVRHGSEEYLDSEKYEIRHWDINRPDSLKDFIARVNRIRRDNPALHTNRGLRFHTVHNDEILCYSKSTDDHANIVVVVVNLDPRHKQSGWVELPLEDLNLDPRIPYQVHDLLTDSRYLWHGHRNYVEIDPQVVPAHIFRIRRQVRTERDFEYYL